MGLRCFPINDVDQGLQAIILNLGPNETDVGNQCMPHLAKHIIVFYDHEEDEDIFNVHKRSDLLMDKLMVLTNISFNVKYVCTRASNTYTRHLLVKEYIKPLTKVAYINIFQ